MTWLRINNPLYRNVVINHDMLPSMPDEFILEGILSRVVIMEDDSSKHKGYGANLAENNEEND